MKKSKSNIVFLLYPAMLLAGLFMISCKPDSVVEVPVKRYFESITLQSTILQRPVRYSVYLPEDYEAESKNYACIYLLHGYGDDETAWVKGGRIDRIIEDLEENGSVDPMIYVMPQGYNSYYVNRANGTLDYMRMFVEELVPLIDSVYRTKADRTQRAVVGYSMGGYGALILPAKHPEVFSVSVPLSMSFRTDEQYMLEAQSAFDAQWGPVFGAKGSTGADRLTDYFKEHSPFHFFAEVPAETFASLNFLIDCGDDEESLSLTNNAMHALMCSRRITHEYRVRNGAHTWDYWLKGMREALPYIQSCFSQTPYPDDPESPDLETFSGKREQIVFSEKNINLALPAEYENTTSDYPVVYWAHQVENERNAELSKVLPLLDSLQQVKPFILIEFDTSGFGSAQALADLADYVDGRYRTMESNRIALGNNSGGTLVYDAAVQYPELFRSLFLFNASPDDHSGFADPEYMYLDLTDASASYEPMLRLYTECREQSVNHQLRVRNGKDTFVSFLNGLNGSIVYLGLMLNH